jgi:hypothetical protein
MQKKSLELLALVQKVDKENPLQELDDSSEVQKFQEKYCQAVQMAHDLGFTDFFNDAFKNLVRDIQSMMSSGTLTNEQALVLIGTLKALVCSQERFLLRELAGAVKQ